MSQLDKKTKEKSNVALIGLAVTGSLAIGVSVIAASFVKPALRRICLPYVPATNKQLENVLRLCKNGGRTLVDLGSGDGRIIHMASRNGFIATGYEINPWLVWYSRFYSKFHGLKNTKFERKDLWKVDLSEFDNIVIFGVSDMMDELSYKLENELNSNAHVIACRFDIQRWRAIKTIEDGIDSAWLYSRKSF